MAPAFSDIIQSGQFTFFIGEDKEPVIVHSSAIVATSEPFDRLINGRMNEAQTRCVEIQDVGKDDFIRFCEFCYRGDYTVPVWNIDKAPTESLQNGHIISPKEEVFEESEPIAVQSPEYLDEVPPEMTKEISEEYPWGSISTSTSGNKRKGKKGKKGLVDLRSYFRDREFFLEIPKNEIIEAFKPTPNSSSDQNFTPVFLAHARLYSFADQYLVMPLKSLTLHKLHTTLTAFELYHNRVSDIIELARYAYSSDHTRDRNDDGSLDKLRQLVVEYIACEIDIVGKSIEFSEFLEEGGQFVGDFWKIVKKYLV